MGRSWGRIGTVVAMSATLADPRRLVPLDAVHNFRDLGGYRTADGRTTRWRTLFRADGLGKLTAADVDAVRPLGLRTVIDLRTRRELDEHGRFPVESHFVHFHHVSVIQSTWEEGTGPDPTLPVVEFLLAAYTEILDVGASEFARALRVLGQPGALPAVFHCAAGKDRTGILAALVLGALGVPHPDIAADYGLTREAMVRMRAWDRRNRPEVVRDDQPSVWEAAEPAAMQRFLDDLAAAHGSVRAFVRDLGVGAGTLADLEHQLLG